METLENLKPKQIQQKKVEELKNLCRQYEIKGFSGLDRESLIKKVLKRRKELLVGDLPQQVAKKETALKEANEEIAKLTEILNATSARLSVITTKRAKLVEDV